MGSWLFSPLPINELSKLNLTKDDALNKIITCIIIITSCAKVCIVIGLFLDKLLKAFLHLVKVDAVFLTRLVILVIVCSR